MKNKTYIARTVAVRIRTFALLVVCLAAAVRTTHGDTVGTRVAATPLDSTQYESTNSTAYEEAALIGANAMLVPLALAAAAVSFAPPSAGVLVENGATYATLGFTSGIGIGTAKPTGRFADARLMLSYVHVYNRHQPDIWRAEAVKDIHCCFIDKRKLLLLGASPSAGIFARGADRGYSLGASVRLMIPSLPYFGLFPLHTIGITYRYNRYFSAGSFHTVALGVSAAVVF